MDIIAESIAKKIRSKCLNSIWEVVDFCQISGWKKADVMPTLAVLVRAGILIEEVEGYTVNCAEEIVKACIRQYPAISMDALVGKAEPILKQYGALARTPNMHTPDLELPRLVYSMVTAGEIQEVEYGKEGNSIFFPAGTAIAVIDFSNTHKSYHHYDT